MKLTRGSSLSFLRQKECGYFLSTLNISEYPSLLFGIMTQTQDRLGFFGHTQQKQTVDKLSRNG